MKTPTFLFHSMSCLSARYVTNYGDMSLIIIMHMSLTMSEIDFVENMAQEQLRYENIFQRQNEMLSVSIPKFEAAVLEFQNSSPFFAKPGQCWEPAQENVGDYLQASGKFDADLFYLIFT